MLIISQRIILMLLSLMCVICLSNQPSQAAQDSLLLYCGAGLRQPAEELIDRFQKDTGITVRAEFAGSGQAVARYLASKRGDVILPGSHFYINKLKKLDQILWSSPVVLHVPVVGFPKSGKVKIGSFADLAKSGVRVGLGDPKAMALGRTAEDILKASGIGKAVLANTVVRGATVKQLVLYLLKGDVDAAIVARADIVQNADKLGMLEIDPGWYKPEIVTVGLLKAAKQEQKARKLAEFLASPAAVKVFNRYGFLTAK